MLFRWRSCACPPHTHVALMGLARNHREARPRGRSLSSLGALWPCLIAIRNDLHHRSASPTVIRPCGGGCSPSSRGTRHTHGHHPTPLLSPSPILFIKNSEHDLPSALLSTSSSEYTYHNPTQLFHPSPHITTPLQHLLLPTPPRSVKLSPIRVHNSCHPHPASRASVPSPWSSLSRSRVSLLLPSRCPPNPSSSPRRLTRPWGSRPNLQASCPSASLLLASRLLLPPLP